MDYSKAIDSVDDTIAKCGKPLNEAQRMMLAGAMAVWLEKATMTERKAWGHPVAWANAEGFISSAPGGGYNTPLHARANLK